jgi:hypothetical protein
MSNWSYRIENLSLWFQGGIRKNVLILLGVSLILLFPVYLVGNLGARIWDITPINLFKSDFGLVVNNIKLKRTDPAISKSQLIELINNENILYASINNSVNKNIGFSPLVYNVQILDKQKTIIKDEVKTTYLLPEEVKYISSNSFSGGDEIKIKIDWDKTITKKYNPNTPNKFKNAKINIRNSSVANLENNNVRVYSILKNQENFEIKNLDVNYILRDSRDNIVGIGSYQFNGFAPNTEREIDLIFPKHKDKTATTLDLRYSINYFNN